MPMPMPKTTAPGPTFDFLAQCDIVQSLLNSCVAVLAVSPDSAQKDDLVKSLRHFESFAAATTWGLGDVSTESDLSIDEKRATINLFVDHYMCSDADWSAIDHHARQVLMQRAGATPALESVEQSPA